MSKEKLTNQLKNAYKHLEEEFKNKGRPNTIEDNNVDYDNCNIYAMRQKIFELEAKLAESERKYQEYRQIVEKDIEKEVDERMRDTIKEFNFDISQIKQQLAEKDKLINEYADEHAMLQCKIADLVVKEIKAEDFAIDILEELADCSNYINSKLDFECGFYVSEKTIRDKIKHLKGNENE